MAKQTLYFSHDFGARHDKKLAKVKLKYKMCGVGIYWCLVEMLHEDGGKLNIEDIDDVITDELKEDNTIIRSVIFDFNLFHNDGKQFWSNSALERISMREEKSKKASKSASSRWENANALQTHCDGNAINKRNKEKKEINKKILAPAEPAPTTTQKIDKVEKKIFIPPTLAQAKEYFSSTIGNTKNQGSWPADKCDFEAAKFIDHYAANGWVQNGNKKIRDWKAACRNWIRNALSGTFEKTAAAPKAQTPVVTHPAAIAPGLSKIETEINYLYDRFLEGNCTIISVDVTHYNHVKKTKNLHFDNTTVSVVEQKAIQEMKENGYIVTEASKISFMKKFGLLEFFKIQRDKNCKTIFDEPSEQKVATG